jgi:hypothetical protein
MDNFSAHPIIDQLKDFLQDAGEHMVLNRWIVDETMMVYIRKGKRYLGGQLRTTLDIASIEVMPKHQRKGKWGAFIKEAIRLNPWDGVYIENCLNPYLRRSLRRAGWVKHVDEVAPSFYKLKETSNES